MVSLKLALSPVLTNLDFADKLISKYIDNHEKGSDDRYSFLGELLAQDLPLIKIRTELLNVLLAGRETTSALLSNLFFTLSRRSDIQSRLRAEIGDLRNLEFEKIKNLKYLRAFINESLRLYPIVPINSREALQDTSLPIGGGIDGKSPIFVPKGRTVVFNIYALHRRTDIYGEDANEFKPERWLDEGDRKGIRPGWAYLPFNGGPRICIGRKFVLLL
jgi:cytochrome P450